MRYSIGDSQVVKRQRLKKLRSRLLSKQARIAMAVTFVVISCTVYYMWSKRSVLSYDIVSGAGFSVYAPQDPPRGYALDKDTIVSTRNTLSYTFEADTPEKGITITAQPIPPGFDMSRQIDKGSIQSVPVKSGTLYNLSTGGSSQYMLNTGDSLIFITSPSNTDMATISSLADSLVKQN